MSPSPNASPADTADSAADFSYNSFGKNSAKDCLSNPNQLDGALDRVYEHFLREAHLDENGRRQRIAQLEAEVLSKQNEMERLAAQTKTLANQQALNEEKLHELKENRMRIRSNEPDAPDNIAFAIGAFITLLLTGFVFLFYFSAGYATLVSKTPTVSVGGLFDLQVFTQAQDGGAGTVALLSLFPVIFLGLGFLVHDALDKERFGLLAVLVGFTLLTDGLIGYRITQARYLSAHSENPESWHASLVFSEPDFYLVLALGFAVYLIWGTLLHYVLTKYREMQPNRLIEVQLERNAQLQEEQQTRLSEILNQQAGAEGQRKSLANDIAQVQRDIVGYRNGVIPVNVARLRGIVADFQQGWIGYTTYMLSADQAIGLNAAGTERIERWLAQKLLSLDATGTGRTTTSGVA